MELTLTLGWLYPQIANCYGDRGNIIALEKQCKSLGISLHILKLDLGYCDRSLSQCDIFFMGGSQDQQQWLAYQDLLPKADILKDKIERGHSGLFICAGYQLLGTYCKEADGRIYEGVGIFDMYTIKSSSQNERLVGNVMIRSANGILIGFENHLGRTYLQNNTQPLGKVLLGRGNNGEDKTEGARYKNCFGSYLHGPFIPKNPRFAFDFIQSSIKLKYGDVCLLEKTIQWKELSLTR